ncbi:uncharacterized protein LOC131887623 [Tigriopus californicus]|uniref:uncharacterized protein LOC131887623 n=1 Tax=Tigriopus californicus TaxID=6832 RepID=UPI0027DA11B6|nr:uncharacterized protein LOC131887623 [Tigriopus californicus]
MKGIVFFQALVWVTVSIQACPEIPEKPIPDTRERLFQDYAQFKAQLSPFDRQVKGQLPDYSEECNANVIKAIETFLDRAKSVSKWSFFQDDREKLFLDTLLWECSTQLEALGGVIKYFAPVDPFEGVQLTWPALMAQTKLESRNDMDDYLGQLSKIPKALRDIQTLLASGMAEGVTYSQSTLAQTDKQFSSLQVTRIEDSPFYQPFKKRSLFSLGGDKLDLMQSRAKTLIRDQVLPSFKNLANFLQSEYHKAARKEPGISSLPKGLEMYQSLVKFHTALEMPPQVIHDIGMNEVLRLQSGVGSVIQRLGLNMTFIEYSRFTRNNPKENFLNRRSLLDQMRDLIANKINPKLEASLPSEFLGSDFLDVKVEPMSENSLEFAAYNEHTRTVEINTKTLSSLKKFDLKSLLLSLANPGRNLQSQVKSKSDFLPDFMTMTSNYAPSYPSYRGFTDGWSLYAVYLGDEMDLFMDSGDLIGFYAAQLSNAADLVVDTGINTMNWSHTKGLAFYLEHTFMDATASEMRLAKISSHPGALMASKLGERAIMSLRVGRERLTEVEFQLKDFHAQLLRCQMPLELLPKCMDIKDVV